MRSTLRLLRIAAPVEFVTLVVLLANLSTVHWPAVSSLIGPTHGCAYLFVIIAGFRDVAATRLMALIPGIGLLALRQLDTATAAPTPGRAGRP